MSDTVTNLDTPRVPPGWPQAIADLVWQDWLAALAGGDQPPLCMASDIDPELCHALERGGCVSVWTYTRQDRPGELYYIAAWKSVEARLRAWAAVGAPVLAPAEDGRPSLAEWVAACEGSALGAPETVSIAGGSVHAVWSGGVVKAHAWASGRTEVFQAVWSGVGLSYSSESVGTYSTPAALRAALDALAVRA